MRVRVRPGSEIHVDHNAYSVHSRLIGERVDVRLYAEHWRFGTGEPKHVAHEDKTPSPRGRLTEQFS